MGVVHCLESNAGIIAVEVAILHEILDGIDNLGTVSSLSELELQRLYLLEQTCLLEPGFQHWPKLACVDPDNRCHATYS